MANKKFSQFELRTDQAQVEALVGYDGLDNIQIDPNLVGTKYDLTGAETANDEFTVTLTGSDSTSDNVIFTGQSGIELSAGPNPNEVIIERAQGALLSVSGIFVNLFGGNTALFGDTLEFNGAASPSTANSSVFPIPFDCRVKAIQMKWIHSTPAVITGTDLWKVNLYKMINPNLSTTDPASYNLVANIPDLTLDASDSGTFPYKASASTLPLISLNAGDIINISGVETGNISADDAEMELSLILELDL